MGTQEAGASGRHPPWEVDVIIQVTEDEGLTGNREEREKLRKILVSTAEN